MKIKHMKLGFLIAAACLSSQTAGYSDQTSGYPEMVRGKVSAVNAEANFLLVQAQGRLDYAKQPERIQFRDQPDTVYEGILGLDDLKRGDEVVVETVEDKRGPWPAKRIVLKKVSNDDGAEKEKAVNKVNEGGAL